MINFNSLELVVNEKFSFVGILRENNQLKFCLPKGFADQLKHFQGFDYKCKLFFLFYQIFEEFKLICIEKSYLQDNLKTLDRDGLIQTSQGSGVELSDQKTSENIFYSKLDVITNILNAFDEPKILSLVYRLGRSEKINYERFDKLLHHAVFLPNGNAHIDFTTLPRPQVQFESVDIVAMYCYILWEIKKQFNHDISEELKSLAERFRQHYIGSEYGLFQEEFYDQVIDLLKDALELIDRNTPLKDSDYWNLYEAIELFLYGELNNQLEGEIWGVKNFNSVWESMCLNYLVKHISPEYLLYLDTRYISNKVINTWKKTKKIIDFANTFTINSSSLRPDAVIVKKNNLKLPENSIYLISPNDWDDFKYYTTINLLSEKFKIAYVGQPEGNHVVNELKSLYPQKRYCIEINHPLPVNYFSYWDIDEISIEQIRKMQYFNHVFYVSIKNNLFSYEGFQDISDLFSCLYSKVDHSSFINSQSIFDVFKYSLFRIRNIQLSFKLISEKFSSFVKLFFEYSLAHFAVIDIKYLTKDIFYDPNKIEEIKRRSIRKQFVYEYLIQKKVEKQEEIFNKLDIVSYFWLPNCPQIYLFEDCKTFMDGYIKLKNVDFIRLAEDYCSQDFASIRNDLGSMKSAYQLNIQSTWSIGDKIIHPIYGNGYITHLLGSKINSLTLAIKFENIGQKLIDPRYVEMQKIN